MLSEQSFPIPGSSSWCITPFYSFTVLIPLSTCLSHWRILHGTDLDSSCSLLGPSSQDGVWCMWGAPLVGVGLLEGDKEGCIWREAQLVQVAPVWPLTCVRGWGGRGSPGAGGRGVCVTESDFRASLRGQHQGSTETGAQGWRCFPTHFVLCTERLTVSPRPVWGGGGPGLRTTDPQTLLPPFQSQV